jgi:hypothetical protein
MRSAARRSGGGNPFEDAEETERDALGSDGVRVRTRGEPETQTEPTALAEDEWSAVRDTPMVPSLAPSQQGHHKCVVVDRLRGGLELNTGRVRSDAPSPPLSL